MTELDPVDYDIETDPPSHSVLWQGRLAAYVWPREGGHLRRSGLLGRRPIIEIPFAEIMLFDATREQLFVELIRSSRDLQGLLFKLEVEGFDLTDGAATPNLRHRRF